MPISTICKENRFRFPCKPHIERFLRAMYNVPPNAEIHIPDRSVLSLPFQALCKNEQGYREKQRELKALDNYTAHVVIHYPRSEFDYLTEADIISINDYLEELFKEQIFITTIVGRKLGITQDEVHFVLLEYLDIEDGKQYSGDALKKLSWRLRNMRGLVFPRSRKDIKRLT
jgi:hypothetical protein